jgi:hypothetical protein
MAVPWNVLLFVMTINGKVRSKGNTPLKSEIRKWLEEGKK